jgi:DNA repair protein RecN (Recombination protein N)
VLSCLRIKNLAIIDELEIVLGPGLNVITGETGAGKSILVDALQLVLGAKARPELVRTGAASAEVEALFDLPEGGPARRELEEAGLLEVDGPAELVVRRVVRAGGRSRAYLNGRLAAAAQLVEVVGPLVDISSQHEHHTLVDPATHLAYLDAFGRLEGERTDVAERVAALEEADGALREAEEALARRTEREDLLRYQLQEIDAFGPEEGEEDSLREERERLRHAERLGVGSAEAEDALYSADASLTEALGQVAHRVRELAGLDGSLGPVAELLEGAVAQVEDAARELGAYARDVRLDPERLQEVEERLHGLKRLLRKYGGSVEDVLAHRDEAAKELAGLDEAEGRLEALGAAREALLGEAAVAARALSQARRKVADGLAGEIGEELATLGMGGARIRVEVEPLPPRGEGLAVDGARLSRAGLDRVELLIAPNKGEEVRPLRQIASGGELSRALLAIKRVLSGIGGASLYVFDEVDTGVGGGVAETIGRKLADVAAHHQVVCITHLAQIAAYGARHYHVRKEVVDERTRSRIVHLRDEARLEELARMVGGLRITEHTRRAARDLLQEARAHGTSASP